MTGAVTAIVIVLIVIAGITAMTVAFFQTQRHRSDAVAMASYRRLAEQAVANQEELSGALRELGERVAAVEKMMREVG